MCAERTSYSKKLVSGWFIYVGFELLLMMNKQQSMQTLLLLGTILAVGISGLANSNVWVHAATSGYQAVGYNHENDNHDKKCNDGNDDNDDKDCKKNKYDWDQLELPTKHPQFF